MATATTPAAIEKIVRKILDEEFDRRNEQMLEAIDRLSSILTEQVIPRLSGKDGASEEPEEPEEPGEPGEPGIDDEESSDGDGEEAAAGSEDDEDVGVREDGDEPAAQGAPPAAVEAFEALYQSMTKDQAEAFQKLFAAIGQ